MDKRIAELMVCPSCHSKVIFAKRDPAKPHELTHVVCKMERLAYPVRDGMPIMLREEAIDLMADDPVLA